MIIGQLVDEIYAKNCKNAFLALTRLTRLGPTRAAVALSTIRPCTQPCAYAGAAGGVAAFTGWADWAPEDLKDASYDNQAVREDQREPSPMAK